MNNDLSDFRIEKLEGSVDRLTFSIEKLDRNLSLVNLKFRFYGILIPILLFCIGILIGIHVI